MDAVKITDWMSAIGTVIAAFVAAPAAVYAAIHTRRAADASAKAAEEAAQQVRELRIAREPRAVLKVRVPDPFTGEHDIKFGRGEDRYRSGPPVYVDVWNVSGPTLMVMEVSTSVNGESPDPITVGMGRLTPQLLVESGKVASINVAYQLYARVSPRSEGTFCDFPDLTTAEASFKVDYFSINGEQSIETHCKFQFRVNEEHLVAWVVESLPCS